jgi:hypothetical protein
VNTPTKASIAMDAQQSRSAGELENMVSEIAKSPVLVAVRMFLVHAQVPQFLKLERRFPDQWSCRALLIWSTMCLWL